MPRFDPNKYVDVQERINRFWQENPEGSIVTKMVSNPADFNIVVFEASVYKDQTRTRPDATGYAAEERGNSDRDGANFTSWHENGETSAIGRALANMGYATSREDRPSRQEMQKVERLGGGDLPARAATAPQNGNGARPQIMNPDAPASDKQLGFIRALAKDAGMVTQHPDGSYHTDESALVAIVGAQFQQDWPRITKQTASELIEQLQSERSPR